MIFFRNDAKDTFIFPMTSPGNLNEVEQKITREKNLEKNDKSNDWKSMESFIVEQGTVQTLKLISTSTRVILPVRSVNLVDEYM